MDSDAILSRTDHRGWPPPSEPWVMSQRWESLLFLHWPVSPDQLRPLVPQGLELDVRGGQGWVTISPLQVRLRPRWLPAIPGISTFSEINVRTYVVREGRPGILFLSLDTPNPLAVSGARQVFGLPYFRAESSYEKSGEWHSFTSQRPHGPSDQPPAEFAARYRATSAPWTAARDSLDAWLTNRFVYFQPRPGNQLVTAEIHHLPWPLRDAEASVGRNTMALAHGIVLPPGAPALAHCVDTVDCLVWRPRTVTVRT